MGQETDGRQTNKGDERLMPHKAKVLRLLFLFPMRNWSRTNPETEMTHRRDRNVTTQNQKSTIFVPQIRQNDALKRKFCHLVRNFLLILLGKST